MATPADMVFFEPMPKSLDALRRSTLNTYLSAFPQSSDILRALAIEVRDRKRKEHNLDVSYMRNLDKPAPELLAQPLPMESFGDLALKPYPPEFARLTEEIDFYIEVLCDVLHNQLAEEPYEVLSDREFVSEEIHAKQAAKLALLVNLPVSDVLSLLFHDIARPSVKEEDKDHGHKKHCQEGGDILQPLGLSMYTAFHAIAKDLLAKLCMPYCALISGTSEKSLKIQRGSCIDEQREALKRFEQEKSVAVATKVMGLRVLDDLAKVPVEEIKKYLKPGEEPAYFSKDLIRQLLKKHMADYLHSLKADSQNIPETVQTMETALDNALRLLLRAQPFSKNPDLYTDHAQLCERLGFPVKMAFG